ncbi:MAG: hypothetical protein COW03_14105 [Cytophagales bacterium CG12_big_fil_rev_8_21_14_0_65_40_12]|nr:MAG: hypothetical protein COW03_14105 [Cytophagales bacterium CG12_big_fil_rev_8_21_14_0_65_40_12]PIW06092.1 MAG: hypothetical protein COW40_01280 [Cytophagales bacterium CG17_big_fil_post_rev_8_21_14_2_50_40_13]
MNADYTMLAYSIYLVLTIGLTIWVARTLFKNGRIFLVDIYHGNEPLADSVNQLLVVGFYLINIGYAVFTLQNMGEVDSTVEMMKTLSKSVGAIILILGAMHFFNLFIFFEMRKRAKANLAS